MDNYAKRIAWLLNTIIEDVEVGHGIKHHQLAKQLGTDSGTISRYREGRGLLKGDTIANLIKLYNVDPRWVYTGEGEPYPNTRHKYPEVCGPEYEGVVNRRSSDRVVFVPNVALEDLPEEWPPQKERRDFVVLGFRADWLARRGNLDKMVLTRMKGDIMIPTIYPGDPILIDMSRCECNPGQCGIYAVRYGGVISVVRVQCLPGKKIRLSPDNKVYTYIEVPEDEVKVCGRLIGYARDLEAGI